MGFSVCSAIFFYPLQSHWPYEKHLFYCNLLTVCMFKKKSENNYSNWVTECTGGARQGKNIFVVAYFPFLTAHIVSLLE